MLRNARPCECPLTPRYESNDSVSNANSDDEREAPAGHTPALCRSHPHPFRTLRRSRHRGATGGGVPQCGIFGKAVPNDNN